MKFDNFLSCSNACSVVNNEKSFFCCKLGKGEYLQELFADAFFGEFN